MGSLIPLAAAAGGDVLLVPLLIPPADCPICTACGGGGDDVFGSTTLRSVKTFSPRKAELLYVPLGEGTTLVTRLDVDIVLACSLYNVSASELIRFILTKGATAFRCDDVIDGLLTTGTWFSLHGDIHMYIAWD